MRRGVWALVLSACGAQTVQRPPNFVLPPARVTTRSELVLKCDPVDAEVSLDNVPQGTCEDFDGEPKALPIPSGARRIAVKKRGFQPWNSILETDGTRVVMTVTLISTGGTP